MAISSCPRLHLQLVLQRLGTGHYHLTLHHCYFWELVWSLLKAVSIQGSLDVALCYHLTLHLGLRVHQLEGDRNRNYKVALCQAQW